MQELIDRADRAKGDPPPDRPAETAPQAPPPPVADPTPEAKCLAEIKDVLDKYGMTLGVRHVEFSVRPRGEG